MLKKHAQLFEALILASDLSVASLSWVVAYWVRFRSGFFPVEKGIPPFSDYLKMLVFVWFIWAFVFRRFGLYQPMRVSRRFREVWTVIKANALSIALLLIATYLFREKSVPFSRLVFVIFWGISTVLEVASRTGVRATLRAMRRRGYNLRHMLIVGSGELAKQVAHKFFKHPEFGVNVLGCLTADSAVGDPSRKVVNGGGRRGSVIPLHRTFLRSVDDAEKGRLQEQLRVIGSYSDIPRLLESGGVDELVIALPLDKHEQMPKVISLIGDSMVQVRIVPDLHRFIKLGSEVESIDGLPVVSLASTPLCGFNQIVKRVFDLVFATLLLLCNLPVFVLVALAVKLTSKGPIFFSQERVGLDGESFRIYKFRTMRTDAESEGARFAVKNDPRVTCIGSFLRRWNLDELPQLVNVICGQMSLVGPRPERPVFIKEFRRHFPHYMLRHKVQAGMTGWAQVNGWRGNTSIAKRIEHDLFYIENWSIIFDLRILIMTIFSGFGHRNAY